MRKLHDHLWVIYRVRSQWMEEIVKRLIERMGYRAARGCALESRLKFDDCPE